MADTLAVVVPRETVNDESVKLLRFCVADGDEVIESQLLAEVETSKAVLEIEAPRAGFVKLAAKVGTEVPIGQPICYVGDSSSGISEPVKQPAMVGASSIAPSTSALEPLATVENVQVGRNGDHKTSIVARFTPLAKRMADANGLSHTDFLGITIVRSKDVHEKLHGPAPATTAPSAKPAAPAAEPVAGVEVAWEDLPRRKQVEIKQIGGGMANVLLSSVTVCAPTNGLKAAIDSLGIEGLSTTAIIVFETARLLRKYPSLNAVYRDGKAGLYQSVNVGLAIDDGSGLMVPVIKDADQKPLRDLASEATSLVGKYLEKSLSVQDFLGATFTVSDLSSEGVFVFAPLVSQGQAAILGVGGEFFAPGATAGMFSLTLAFDHQLADGRIAARFLADLTGRLAAYEQLGVKLAEAPPTTLQCSFCARDQATLLAQKHFLLKSVAPEGFVCSLCLGGF